MGWFGSIIFSFLACCVGGFALLYIIAEIADGATFSKKTARIILIVISIAVIVGTFFLARAMHGSPISDDDSDDYSYNSNKSYSDNSNWGNYDYDNDGDINQNEWEDALGDYMDSVMP